LASSIFSFLGWETLWWVALRFDPADALSEGSVEELIASLAFWAAWRVEVRAVMMVNLHADDQTMPRGSSNVESIDGIDIYGRKRKTILTLHI
jgi:hypothetical protein